MAHPFIISETSPVTYGGPLPQTADVVVIGGGVIGVTTALYLARSGRDVVLLEKGRIAGEQSSRNWGWIRQQGRDPAELPIMMESVRLWEELASDTNVDFGLRRCGVTFLARTSDRMERFDAWTKHAEDAGLETCLLNGSETASMFPDMEPRFAGAMYTPSDMRAEPWKAVPALAGIAVRAGARIVEQCAVRMLNIAGGHVAGVVTERGLIKASNVVLAGGAWSSLFLRNHGVSLPQLAVRQSVVATPPMPEITATSVADKGIAVRRRQDGGYTLGPAGTAELYIGPDAFRALPKYLPQLRADPFGQSYLGAAPRGFPDAWSTRRRWSGEERTPFEDTRVLNPKPNAKHVKRLTDNFKRLFPKVGMVRPKATWAGMIDTMPDVVPVLDHCPEIPGLVIGTGMSGHGFGIGPGMGKALAALVTGDDVGHDLRRFRATRFSDGSPIELGPNV